MGFMTRRNGVICKKESMLAPALELRKNRSVPHRYLRGVGESVWHQGHEQGPDAEAQ